MSHGPSQPAILVTGAASAETDRRLARLIEFAGVACRPVPVAGLLGSELAALATRGHGLVLSGAAAAQLLRSHPAGRPEALRLITGFGSTLVYDATPATLPVEDLRALTRDATAGYAELDATASYRISDQHRELCGPLSGLTLEREPGKSPCGIQFSTTAPVDALITVAGKATFAGLPVGDSRLFIGTGSTVVDLTEEVSSNFQAAALFPGLVPYLMYLRSAFPALVWRAKRPLASLVIDDPPLRPRYGFLKLSELLAFLDESRSAANLAFIPWNAGRSQTAVVNQVRGARRLALCIHGCDHTGAEFASQDEAWLDMLVRLALERMDGHQRQTGVAHQRVMVFPQGIFSRRAMQVLKHRNFVAAVNTEVVPGHQSAQRGQVALGDLLSVAMTTYDSFPLFSRRNCTDPVANYALDLFLGKPCLFVAHHGDFRAGFGHLKQLFGALNGLAPDLKWTTLGELLDESYTWRPVSEDVVAVRMFANRMVLRNDGPRPVRFEIRKPESDITRLKGVWLDDTALAFGGEEGQLRAECALAPGRTACVCIEYRDAVDGGEVPRRSLRYRARSAMRRYLTDVRDDYVQPLKQLLAGGPARRS